MLNRFYGEMSDQPKNVEFQANYRPNCRTYKVKGINPIIGMKQGVKGGEQLKSSELTEGAQKYVGWYCYILTESAFQKLQKKYNVSLDMML